MRALFLLPLPLLLALAGACSVDDSILEQKKCYPTIPDDQQCIKGYKCAPDSTGRFYCTKNAAFAPGNFPIVQTVDETGGPAVEASLRLLRQHGVLSARTR